MESRLSEHSVTRALDAGHQNLAWQVPAPSGFLAGIDFKQVLASPNAREIIQAMPPQPLYFALTQAGLADSLDVLANLSQEQVTRMLDYDVWPGDRLDPKRAYAWLRYFGEISSKELATRFADLEEEYQLAMLEGLINVFTEDEYEKMSPAEQDSLFAMPCHKFFYRIMTDDPAEGEFVEQLIASLVEAGMLEYAYSLLAHAAYVPPQEAEGMLARFRRARLEEDGFVSYEASLEVFAPFDPRPLKAKWRRAGATTAETAPVAASERETGFLDLVLRRAYEAGWDLDEQYAVHTGLLHLANTLTSAAQVEPADLQGLCRVLEQSKALVSLGLEILAGGDVNEGLRVVKTEHPRVLFQVGLAAVHELGDRLLDAFVRYGLNGAERLRQLHRARRAGLTLKELEESYRRVLGFEATEILKGLFNRFPMRPELFGESTETKPGQIEFAPLRSIRDLALMTDYVNGVGAMLWLASQAGDLARSQSLDHLLTTATIRAMTRGEFVAAKLSEEDGKAFMAMSLADVTERSDALSRDIAAKLGAARSAWVIAPEGDGLQTAMALFANILTGIFLAKQSDRPAPVGRPAEPNGEATL